MAVNAPDGTAVASNTTASTPSASKVPSPAPGAAAAAKQPADAFRDFVSTEKDRLMKKKQAIIRSEMDKRLSDLVSFSKSFKLNKPIPDDLVPILAKDEDKQRAIKEKSSKDAEDSHARSIGISTTLAATPGARAAPPGKGADTSRAQAVKPSGASGSSSMAQKTATAPSKPADSTKKINMFIQPIPPFKGKRSAAVTAPVPSAAPAAANGAAKPAASPLSPTAQNRLNVNASSFRPNVKASSFSPVSVLCLCTRVVHGSL